VEELIAMVTHVSQVPNFISVSEGERLYVVERHNSDWWFVRKKITNESGYIQSKLLVDSTSYTHILQNKVEEKIKKLPVFESKFCYYTLKSVIIIAKISAVIAKCYLTEL